MKRFEPRIAHDDEDGYADMREDVRGDYVKVEDVRLLGSIILRALAGLRSEGAHEKADALAKDASKLMEGI